MTTASMRNNGMYVCIVCMYVCTYLSIYLSIYKLIYPTFVASEICVYSEINALCIPVYWYAHMRDLQLHALDSLSTMKIIDEDG